MKKNTEQNEASMESIVILYNHFWCLFPTIVLQVTFKY